MKLGYPELILFQHSPTPPNAQNKKKLPPECVGSIFRRVTLQRESPANSLFT